MGEATIDTSANGRVWPETTLANAEGELPETLFGAYGIRIGGLTCVRDALVPCHPSRPLLRVAASMESPEPMAETLDEEFARVHLKTGGALTLDRRSGVAHFKVPRRLSDEELVHPYLTPAASIFSHWLGRLSFHAGAFALAGGVWGVVGERETGKSSLLAWLALRGHDVFADDLLVVEGLGAFAGPRSLDLREPAAARLGVGQALGLVGARSRWRVRLPAVVESLPIRGWFFLSWGERDEATRLTPRDLLARLISHLSLQAPPSNPAGLLELASLPGWELRRPARWTSMSMTAERLLELSASSSRT